jgi:PHP family Zn ribbon phosphoesterase
MCMVDYSEGSWQVYDAAMIVGRTDHKCSECGRTIKKGERHERTDARDSEFGWMHFRTCAHCIEARKWLKDYCGGWLHEGVSEDLAEHLEEYGWDRRFWPLRAIVPLIQRGWKNRRGRQLSVSDVARLRAQLPKSAEALAA